MHDKLQIFHKGKISGMMNPDIVKKQGLGNEQIENIKTLHRARLRLFDYMEKLTDPEQLKSCVLTLENLEFKMQKEWGFEQDKGMHSWWFQAPHCECPNRDNWDLWEAEKRLRVINKDCPLHG